MRSRRSPRRRRNAQTGSHAGTPAATVTPAPVPDDPNVDLVYGAYQRGQYKTAFDLATQRAQEKSDPKAMTMLGELYANAMGVKRDYAKAAEWYQRAADAGDREAMFALAMLRLAGRGGPVNREEAVKLLASSAKLGNPKAAYNLALLYLDGQTLPQDLKRAAELLRVAADAGNPEAQYALATFYKEGTGVPKDPEKSVRLLQAASLADNVDAEVEYAIALYNGTGTPKNQPAAVALLRKAAQQEQSDRAKPPRLCAGERTGRADGQGRGPEMAPCRENRRQGRPHARRGVRRPQPGGSRQGRGGRAQMARQQMIRLDATPTAGHPVRAPILPSGRRLTVRDGERAFSPSKRQSQAGIMLHSALINVMVKAARRAGRSLKRDLGEVENLQVSLKGPANFVTMADRRAEEMLYADLTKARPGLRLHRRGRRHPRRRRQEPHLDRRSARRHHQLPARHPAICDFDRAAARGHHHRRPDLQSGQ